MKNLPKILNEYKDENELKNKLKQDGLKEETIEALIKVWKNKFRNKT